MRPSEFRAVSGLEPLAAFQSPRIRYLLRSGRGHQSRLWVLARSEENCHADRPGEVFGTVGRPIELFVLAFSILGLAIQATLGQAKASLHIGSYRPDKFRSFPLLR